MIFTRRPQIYILGSDPLALLIAGGLGNIDPPVETSLIFSSRTEYENFKNHECLFSIVSGNQEIETEIGATYRYPYYGQSQSQEQHNNPRHQIQSLICTATGNELLQQLSEVRHYLSSSSSVLFVNSDYDAVQRVVERIWPSSNRPKIGFGVSNHVVELASANWLFSHRRPGSLRLASLDGSSFVAGNLTNGRPTKLDETFQSLEDSSLLRAEVVRLNSIV